MSDTKRPTVDLEVERRLLTVAREYTDSVNLSHQEALILVLDELEELNTDSDESDGELSRDDLSLCNACDRLALPESPLSDVTPRSSKAWDDGGFRP